MNKHNNQTEIEIQGENEESETPDDDELPIIFCEVRYPEVEKSLTKKDIDIYEISLVIDKNLEER